MDKCACKVMVARYRYKGSVHCAPIIYTCAQHRGESPRARAIRVEHARLFPTMPLALPAPSEVR